jgi:phage terminase large subunit-like protein
VISADIQHLVENLPPACVEAFQRRSEWLSTARPDQLPPEEFFVWMLMAGRGAGKTRSGAEHVWWGAFVEPQRVAVVGPTLPDVRKTAFEGESGLLARIPKGLVRAYNRTSLELWTTTLDGGESYYVGYSSQEPERFRGPQHHVAWCDELGAWQTKTAVDTWDNLLFGLRLGSRPTIVVTTTPRTTPLVRQIVRDRETVIARASTFDNTHLPESILRKFRSKYEGTRLGKQELHAVLLEDVVGAMWTDDMFVHAPEDAEFDLDEFERIVVAVDPSGATEQKRSSRSQSKPNEEKTDTIGIVVVGKFVGRERFAVLADRSVPDAGPSAWGQKVCDVYEEFSADSVVAEVNFGGGMVEAIIRNVSPNIPVKTVRASRGKIKRAEPVAALYEQKKVIHARGLEALEEQMCLMTSEGFQGEGSPDRVDAAVWGLTELSLGRRRRRNTELHVDGEQQVNRHGA